MSSIDILENLTKVKTDLKGEINQPHFVSISQHRLRRMRIEANNIIRMIDDGFDEYNKK